MTKMRKANNSLASVILILFFCAAGVFAQAQGSAQEKSVTVFGAKIRYLEAGDAAKPTVVLLHGLGGSGDGWQGNIPALTAAGYRVIAPDQIGFGKSDKPMLKYRVGTYVDFLDKMLSELKIERATLLGNSMGGWVAALYAVKYPARVDRLILVNAAGLLPKDLDLNLVYSLNSSTREEVRENLKRAIFNSAMFVNDQVVDQFFAQRVASTDGYTIDQLTESIKRREDFLDNRLGEIKKPTLIIWGRQDGLIPVADGERYNKGISGSRLVVFEQCGHVPQLEKPADFTREVLKFLGEK